MKFNNLNFKNEHKKVNENNDLYKEMYIKAFLSSKVNINCKY